MVEFEPLYYSIDALSKKTGVPENELWLHAEQRNLKFSIKFKSFNGIMSRDGFVGPNAEIDPERPPSNTEILKDYNGYLQLRPERIAVIRKHGKGGKFRKETRFLIEGKNYQYVRTLNKAGKRIFVKSIVVLKEHYHEFMRLLNEPKLQEREVYFRNRPTVRMIALYEAALGIYISQKVSGLSVKSSDILQLLLKDSQNDQASRVLRVKDGKIFWKAPTDEVVKDTSVKTFNSKISSWNTHYKTLGL